MEKIKECNKDEKIKVFFSDDEKLKLLGELLSNKSSREIIKLLIGKEYYTNKIADKLNLHVNLVIHHLKKMEELGLLEITNKPIVRKGNNHKHFRINPYLFIIPNGANIEIEQKRIRRNVFKESIKFAMIGITSFIAWWNLKGKTNPGAPNIEPLFDLDPLIIPLLIIIVGLSIQLLMILKKKIIE